MSDSRPASDVYSWAKAETKPSYSYSEISGTPSSLPASDVSSWAKANSKPSYNLDEVTDGTSRKIPTKVSELTNDSGYLTSHQSLSGYATESWVGQQGYLTSHQSLSGYATESWVSSKFNDVLGIDASGVSDLVSILSDNDTATGILNVIASKANASSIPTKVSDLTNDTGFITSYTNTVTSINGKTGEIAATDIATILTAAGYALTDTNTWPTALSQLSNDVGYITGITSSMVTTALGYTPATTDTNTWRPITNTYTGSDEGTSLSQYGANALYNALVNGYASNAGDADTLDGYHYNGLPYLPIGNLTSISGDIVGWGTLTSNNGYTGAYQANTSDGGSLSLAYKSGQVSMQVDGWFYQNEGQYRVLDTSDTGGYSIITSNNIGSQSVNYANSAGSVAWSNVSSRPTALSSFTNDSGYITSSGSCNYATSASAASSATVASYANQLQAFTEDNFTGGEHFVKAIRSSDGWSTRLWMCYNGGAAQANAVQVSYADSAGYASSAGNADTTDNLHVHSGRNNEGDKIVRTDSNGYIQAGYINSSSGDEGNNSSPARVWGTNGSDSYLRTYLTSALSVGYATSAGSAPASDVYSWAKASTKPSYSYSEISGTPSSLPASDVYSWAKASSKPSYAYSEIGYSAYTATTSGALTLDGSTYPLCCITLNGNISSVAFSSYPPAGHSCHIIFNNSGSSDYTVAIAHGTLKCPEGQDVPLTVKAGGYAEIDVLHVENVAYFVRGV